METLVRRMVKEIFAVARNEIKFADPGALERVEKNLVLRLANRAGRSNGGRKDGKPWMSIAMKSIGWRADAATAEKNLPAWERAAFDPLYRGNAKRARRVYSALKKVKETNGAVWYEYDAFAADPEIGNLYGDPADKLAPLAVLLTHELAHVLDYNAGAIEIAGRKFGPLNSVHGTKWREIYRALRNAYVATGAYKPAPAPIAKVIPFRKPAPVAMPLFGLPLFDRAAA